MHRTTRRWADTRLTRLLAIDHPIVQGPFGGGLSSVELAAVVSDAGGLGSFGVHHLRPHGIADVAARLKEATARPFALNLWVSDRDLPDEAMTRSRFDAAVSRLRPLYAELGVAPPAFPDEAPPAFADQAAAVLDARPAVFSVVFGVPVEGLLDACRERGIITAGTATTPEEAVALDEAGVDVVVASGAEAGGHRGAFLREAEDSLYGTLPLVRIVATEVGVPVVAAGGIVDAAGIAAALALGADGVQLGTAYLATDESGTTDEHRAALRDPGSRVTRLTRSYTGRLSRGVPNRLTDELAASGAVEPYPWQSYLLAPVLDAARAARRTDVVALWAGQGAPLVRHHRAAELHAALVAGLDEPTSAPG